MVPVDTVEGWIDDGRVTWHYDVFAGVMHVRIEADAETPCLGEMNDGTRERGHSYTRAKQG